MTFEIFLYDYVSMNLFSKCKCQINQVCESHVISHIIDKIYQVSVHDLMVSGMILMFFYLMYFVLNGMHFI